MHIESREKVLKEANVLLPQLIAITPLTPLFPLALASALELFLESDEDVVATHARCGSKAHVVELLLDRLDVVSTRIGDIFPCIYLFRVLHLVMMTYTIKFTLCSQNFEMQHNCKSLSRNKPNRVKHSVVCKFNSCQRS